MSRMGCYVLLKSRLIKEVRSENHYKARQYTLIKTSGYYYTEYNLIHNDNWWICFNTDQIKYITDKTDNYTCWPEHKVMKIHNHLANCRFDLVYSRMNKLMNEN